MIVSFEVLFKTPVTANEGLAKLRDAVNNNKRLGNFTVEALKIIQPVNPTTAASTEGSTGTVCNSSQKGDLTVKNDMHIRELLQSRHRWQQEYQESNRFNNNNKKHIYRRWMKKIYSLLFQHSMTTWNFLMPFFIEYVVKTERKFFCLIQNLDAEFNFRNVLPQF